MDLSQLRAERQATDDGRRGGEDDEARAHYRAVKAAYHPNRSRPCIDPACPGRVRDTRQRVSWYCPRCRAKQRPVGDWIRAAVERQMR